jgi:RNA polymerase sigma-70 factor (ECF subfamily)
METPREQIERFFAEDGLEYLLAQARNRMRGSRWTPEDQEDLVSWVAVQMWNKAESYRGDCSVQTWALTILENRLRSQFRSALREQRYVAALLPDEDQKPRPLEELPATDADSAPVLAAEFGALSCDVSEVLERLPSNLRDAFELVALKGLSYEEAAEEMHAPRGSVSVWLFRARKQLQNALRSWDPQSAPAP